MKLEFVGSFVAVAFLLVDHGAQGAGLYLEDIAGRVCRGQREPVGGAAHVHVLRQAVPLEVVGGRDLEPAGGAQQVGPGEVDLALLVDVVDVDELVVVVDIAGVVVGVLEVEPHAPEPREVVLAGGLGK